MASAGDIHFHGVELGEIYPTSGGRQRSITSTTLPPPTSLPLPTTNGRPFSNLPSMLLDRPMNGRAANDDDQLSLLLNSNTSDFDGKDGVERDSTHTPEALCRHWTMKRVKAKAPSGGGAGQPELSKELFMVLAKQLTMGEFFSTRLWRLLDPRKKDSVDPELFVKWMSVIITPMTAVNQRDKLHLVFRILDRECRDKFSKTDLFEILDGSFHSTFACIGRDESKKLNITRAIVLKAEKKGGNLEMVESLQKQRKAEEAKIQSYVDTVFSRAALSKTEKITEVEFIKFWGYGDLTSTTATSTANPPEILAWWLKAINYRGTVCLELMKTRLA